MYVSPALRFAADFAGCDHFLLNKKLTDRDLHDLIVLWARGMRDLRMVVVRMVRGHMSDPPEPSFNDLDVETVSRRALVRIPDFV